MNAVSILVGIVSAPRQQRCKALPNMDQCAKVLPFPQRIYHQSTNPAAIFLALPFCIWIHMQVLPETLRAKQNVDIDLGLCQ